jgi:short-subunit dehydrogenase involved in D-alanine esterification of teichoic acids
MKASGNTVLITGGASGIGFELAKKLVATGNTVIICGRDQAKLDAACSKLPGLVAIRADIADPANRKSLAAELASRFPTLNVLVNNAGVVHVTDINNPDFIPKLEVEIATNFLGPVDLISLLLPVLSRSADATIVNITTGYVFLTSARTAPYSATKTALHSMTDALRYQLRNTNIRVLEIMPPPVDTNMANHYNGTKADPAEVAEKFLTAIRVERAETVIGVSKMAKLLARLAPRLGFKIVNDGETKAALKT